MDSPSLVSLLHTKRLIVCVGCGGVGKTTTAAALAVSAARRGRKTAVITVDPAQRLKTALGLHTLSHEPHRVTLNGGRVSFDALALDTKRMFDQLVERLAPDPHTAQRIFANRLYRELSNELAGSAEYMAMEQLHDLVYSGAYELLVVDTPPSAHIQDLLAAPNRLLTLLASRAVRLLQTPSQLVEGASSRTARLALRTLLEALQRWSGLPLLKDLAEFVSAFESMLANFANRAERTMKLLRDPATAFLLVTTPELQTLAVGETVARELQAGGYPLAGIVANRVHMFHERLPAASKHDDALSRRLRQNYLALSARSQRDADLLARIKQTTGLPIVAQVPAQPTPPASLAALEQFAGHLVGAALATR